MEPDENGYVRDVRERGLRKKRTAKEFFCDLQALERVVDWFGRTFQD
jgi:hypothetical protein